MSDEAKFTVGPPQPVTDSRDLPAVTAEDEAGFVSGADLGMKHPDNLTYTDDADVDVDVVLPEPTAEDDEDLPGEDELDALVAEVDADDVDTVGFDDADLEPLGTDPADGLGDRSVLGGS